ncbi:MAG: ribonuclease E inhibitor RraB, partial [Planctomycetota bacterium]
NKPSDDPAANPTAEDQSTFVSESEHKQNRAKQITMAPQTMEQLRGYGVTDDSELKLEYFFYTNTKKKAESLAHELAELGYDGGHDVAAGDPSQFVITGWTTPMNMSDETVVEWTGKMCDLGQKFDCEFDGWGTNPNQ